MTRFEELVIELIRVFRTCFEDLKFCFVADIRNSSADDWSEERSRFSISYA